MKSILPNSRIADRSHRMAVGLAGTGVCYFGNDVYPRGFCGVHFFSPHFEHRIRFAYLLERGIPIFSVRPGLARPGCSSILPSPGDGESEAVRGPA
jgi:hypothetical protein